MAEITETDKNLKREIEYNVNLKTNLVNLFNKFQLKKLTIEMELNQEGYLIYFVTGATAKVSGRLA